VLHDSQHFYFPAQPIKYLNPVTWLCLRSKFPIFISLDTHDGRPTEETYTSWLPASPTIRPQSKSNDVHEYLPDSAALATAVPQQHAGPRLHLPPNTFDKHLLHYSQQWQRPRSTATNFPRCVTIFPNDGR
jgi:hypothetical protein